ncbi:HAD family hydrolase [Carnimonas bestiolae]|uniref:HAD family hydrolase n=1 Tax=Carnimonas bestiolae TaxID=3402172 RepID=UPI003EDBFD37
MALKAILFDFDGTLANTEEAHWRVWNKLLGRYDSALGADDFAANYTGLPVYATVEKLIGQFQLPVGVEELVQQKVNATIDVFGKEPPALMPHVIEALEWAEAAGLRMSIVTGSSRGELDAVCNAYDLYRFFEHSVTRNDVTHSKPDPECYLKALALMELEAYEAVAVEDTSFGVLAADAAQLEVVAVPHEQSRGQDFGAASHEANGLLDAIGWIKTHWLESDSNA